MPTPISRILRAAARRPGDPLNVLTFCTHERTESMIAKTGHSFWALTGPGLKDWDARFAPVPPNYTIVRGPLPADVPVDLVLSQTRGSQYDIARDFARTYRVPHVTLEHVLPPPGAEQGVFARTGDINVFISAYSRDAWRGGEADTIIEHGIDLDLFRPRGLPRRPHILSVVNQWAARDAECGFTFWKRATHGLPTLVLGDNPGLSETASSTEDLARTYASSLIFVNTALISPIPTVLLEAMAAGCIVVSTRNPMIESVIEEDWNGYLADSPEEMREFLVSCLENPGLIDIFGVNARWVAETRFSADRFVADWAEVFERAANLTYTRMD